MPKNRAEIRCCCDAHLIGWVDVDLGERNKSSISFAIGDGKSLEFDIAKAFIAKADSDSIFNIKSETKDALKSKDYPLDLIRQIRGFVEATDDDRMREL